MLSAAMPARRALTAGLLAAVVAASSADRPAPSSPGRHTGAAAASTRAPRHGGQPADPAKHTWVPEVLDAVGSKACLKAVSMVPMLAYETYIAGEGGVVLRGNLSNGAPGGQVLGPLPFSRALPPWQCLSLKY